MTDREMKAAGLLTKEEGPMNTDERIDAIIANLGDYSTQLAKEIAERGTPANEADLHAWITKVAMAAYQTGIEVTTKELSGQLDRLAAENAELRARVEAHEASQICDRTEPPDVPGWWWCSIPDIDHNFVVGIEITEGKTGFQTLEGGSIQFSEDDLKPGILWGRCPIPVTASGEE